MEPVEKPPNPSRLNSPFVLTINAPRGSGKTFLLLNLLIHDNFYNDMFDKIYLITPSAYQDPKYSILDLPSSQIMITFDEKRITKIIKDKHPDDEYLFIFDDIITQDEFKKNAGNDSIINTIAINGRHMNVSMIISSQKTSGVSSFVRSQVDGVYIFKQRSMNEIDAIHNDNSVDGLNRKDFSKLVSKATKEQYSFLMINYQNGKVFASFKEIENIQAYINEIQDE